MAWTPHEEGDAITLAAVNANISALETQANVVSAEAITFKALHSEHLPSVIGEAKSKDVYGTVQTYNGHYPGWEVDTISAGGGLAGWSVVANSAQGDLEIGFTGVDMSKYKVLVMANIGLQTITDQDGTARVGTAAAKIQVQNNGGSWVGVARTERFRELGGHSVVPHKQIPIRTLIDSTDVAALTGVRVVVTMSYYADDDLLDRTAKVHVVGSNLSAITIKQAI